MKYYIKNKDNKYWIKRNGYNNFLGIDTSNAMCLDDSSIVEQKKFSDNKEWNDFREQIVMAQIVDKSMRIENETGEIVSSDFIRNLVKRTK